MTAAEGIIPWCKYKTSNLVMAAKKDICITLCIDIVVRTVTTRPCTRFWCAGVLVDQWSCQVNCPSRSGLDIDAEM